MFQSSVRYVYYDKLYINSSLQTKLINKDIRKKYFLVYVFRFVKFYRKMYTKKKNSINNMHCVY